MLFKKGDKVEAKVVTVKKPLVNIPTLAIHLTEKRYAEFKLNQETDLRAVVETSVNGEQPYDAL